MAILGSTKITDLSLLDGILGNLNPVNTGVYDLGTNSLKWRMLYGNVTGDLTGNASSATKLKNGRTFQIKDADNTNAGTASSAFTGESNLIINLPSTIKATLSGNAATATTATKLGTSNIGATDRPIYLSGGTATQTTYRMSATNTVATTARAITENLETGNWYVNGTNSTDLYSQSDGAAYVEKYNDNWIHEIYGDYRTGQIAVRGKNNGTWQAWRKVLDSSNYTSYTAKKDGTGASGTWGINITGSSASCTGNAATATTATKDSSGAVIKDTYVKKAGDTITGNLGIKLEDTDKHIIFDYDGDGTAGASWRIAALGSGSADTNYFAIQSGTSTTSATDWNNVIRLGQNTFDAGFGGNVYPLANNTKTLGTSSLKWANVYATTFTGALSGNASTATKFASAQSVALTGDITGSASSQAGWSIATTLANSGVTANTYGNTSQQTPAHGGTFNIPYFKVDAKGRITQAGTTTVKLPADNNTDTKNTAGSTDTSSKIYLIGATSQAANPQTYSDNQIYATNGQLDANKVRIAEAVSLVYDSTLQALNFVFT